ncbi:hypothetical protein [Sporosarcina sp. FSL K6-1508]|uniref:hypothetical protein n=1 Tax=Sporosarcina sp. FSL K6-1508 TaxID=2921553 RepID=UPI0030F79EEF
MKILINIANVARTAFYLILFNFLAFWIAKALIYFTLSLKLYTAFGARYVAAADHTILGIMATCLAVAVGWKGDERFW